MAPGKQGTTVGEPGQNDIQSLLRTQLREAVRLAPVAVPEAQVDAFVGALPSPAERTFQ